MGLAAALRPDSTDSGRATGRARRSAQARSQRASEVAPRGKSQGGVPCLCAGGSVHFFSAARAARTRRPRRPQRARACAVPSRAPPVHPAPALALSVFGLPVRSQPVSRGSRSVPGWCWGLVLGTQPTGFQAEGRTQPSQFAFPESRERQRSPPPRPGFLVSCPLRGQLALLGGPEDTARAEPRASVPGPPADSASARARAPTLTLLLWKVSPKQAECPFFLETWLIASG